MEWYPNGTTFADDPVVLHDEGLLPMRVLRAVQGMESPVFTYDSYSTPGVDGVRFGDVSITRPEMRVPVFIEAGTRVQLRQIKSDLLGALNPRGGAGRLVLSEDLGRESGVRRFIGAMYRGGLEGDGAEMGPRWWKFTLRFECGDPNYYTPEPTLARWSGKRGEMFFPFNVKSFSVAPYGVTPTVPLELDGDTEAWPTFTLSAPHPTTGVIGPWSRVRFTNDRTGQWWEKQRASTEVETVVVNTKPGSVSVRNLAGVNRYGFTAGSQLFPLRPASGTHDADTVSVQVEGATADTTFELRVNPAWLTAP